MDLINSTPLAAKVLVGQGPEPGLRSGCLVAKATYRFEDSAGAVLDLERPLPVLEADQPTPLGLIPRDDLIFCDQHLEVILLGTATAPRTTRRMTVSLAVGDQRRELLVSGDRSWLGDRGAGGVSAPEPFSSMPLTWERAFGGRQAVAITSDSELDVGHPLNPAGRGFDPAPMVDGLGDGLYMEPGYPRWHGPRPLPNLEDPAAPVLDWSDDPPPTCWAPAPLDSAMFLARLGGVVDSGAGDPMPPDGASLAARALHPEVLHRAHPGWVIPPPPAGAPLRMEGLTPWSRAALDLPRLRLACDWRLGGRTGSRQLHLARLLLLPDEARLCLTFFHRFVFRPEPKQERALRLRMEESP